MSRPSPDRSGAGSGPARPGVTLPELLVVAWLFALVLLAAAAFAGAQGRLAAVSQDRVRAAEIGRTVDLVLNGELRYAARGDAAPGPDSIRLRAMRGSAIICAGGTELQVRYDGVRRPDPGKDSALVITGEGTVGSVHAVVAAAAVGGGGGCGDLRMRLEPMPTAGAGHLLVFETGTYHLSDGALRYRRGQGGRQPVTEAVMETARLDAAPGTLRARITLSPLIFRHLGSAAALTAVVRRMNAGGPP
ncbi:MAG: hypothetical protein ACN0LA_03410 [Candidatus Longimicrobiales bacterium M2_2A_002]